MKKILITPKKIAIAAVLLVVVVAGGVFAYQQWDSPYRNLPPEEREYREKVDTFEGCLKDAKDAAAREACLVKYPDV